MSLDGDMFWRAEKFLMLRGREDLGLNIHLLDSFENNEMSKKMFVQVFTEKKDYLLTSTTLAG